MSSAAWKLQSLAVADLYAIPDDERDHELLAGEIVQRALPTVRHGSAQGAMFSALTAYGRRLGVPGTPGGWRFATEVDVQLSDDTVVRPDVAGWRRERMPRMPDTQPCCIIPDWICEVLSRSNAATDLLDKVRLYHRAGVGHYWILDPSRQTLRVHRWTEPGYQVVLDVGREARVRAEPFDAIELSVRELMDEDDPE